jgi:hypothetical protein
MEFDFGRHSRTLSHQSPFFMKTNGFWVRRSTGADVNLLGPKVLKRGGVGMKSQLPAMLQVQQLMVRAFHTGHDPLLRRML